MADEEQWVRGIDWQAVFPFTYIFRSFRIAVHLSKIALGLALLLTIYFGGQIMDAAWASHSRAVPGEVDEYENLTTNGHLDFNQWRQNQISAMDQMMAALLERYHIVQTQGTETIADTHQRALAQAHDRKGIGDLQTVILGDRNTRIDAIRKQFDQARVEANNTYNNRHDAPDAQQIRDDAIAHAEQARDQALRAEYDATASVYDQVSKFQGIGLFEMLFEYEIRQVNGVVHAVFRQDWISSDSPRREIDAVPINNGDLSSGFADLPAPMANLAELAGLAPSAAPNLNAIAASRGRLSDNQSVVRHIYNFFAVGPMWLLWNHYLFFILFAALFLFAWSVFGGALSRIAAIHFAREEKISIRQAMNFSVGKILSFASAPIIPLAFVIVIGLIVALVAGLLGLVPGVGPVVIGALFILPLLAGFVMTLVLLGAAGGFNLMYPTIAVEGTDSFDAISRSFSYVYQRPWRMLAYTVVAVAYGAATYLFVHLFIWMMLVLVHHFVGMWIFTHAENSQYLLDAMWPGPQVSGQLPYSVDGTVLTLAQRIGAYLMQAWVMLIVSLLGAFAISLYFSANTIIYYLMRAEVDATELDDVYLEQSEDELEISPAESIGVPEIMPSKDVPTANPPNAGPSPTQPPLP